jgi:hypothetical protein
MSKLRTSFIDNENTNLYKALKRAYALFGVTAVISLALVVSVGSVKPSESGDQTGIAVSVISFIWLLAVSTYTLTLHSEIRLRLHRDSDANAVV